MQHSDDGCSMVQRSEVQHDDEMQHNDRWRSHLGELIEATWLQLISCIIFLEMIYALIYISQSVDFCCKHTISLSLYSTIEEHIRRIDQGFPHIGVRPWLAPHLVSSCLGLSSAIYVYVLSAFYFNADVIVKLEKIWS